MCDDSAHSTQDGVIPIGPGCTLTDIAILAWLKSHAGLFACTFGLLTR